MPDMSVMPAVRQSNFTDQLCTTDWLLGFKVLKTSGLGRQAGGKKKLLSRRLEDEKAKTERLSRQIEAMEAQLTEANDRKARAEAWIVRV